MTIDWDEKLFAPVHGLFGEAITYLPAAGGSFPIADAIFEEAYRPLPLSEEEAEVTTETPAMTVRLAALPAEPVQGDQVQVPTMNATYIVKEPQIDRHAGTALLLLNLVSQP